MGILYKEVINLRDEFVATGRGNSFSYEGYKALQEYLEEMAGYTQEGLQLDVIALDCDFYENTLENILNEYGLETLEELQDNTTVIVLSNSVIIQNF